MTFSQPLKLLAIGGSLITTNTLWFFNDKKGDSKEIDENINAYESSPKLTTRSKTVITDPKLKKVSVDSTGYKFTYEGSSNNRLLWANSPWAPLDDLEIKGDYYATTRKQYLEFPISSIQIKLFDKPVWHDDTSKDDLYKDPLSQGEIEELFRDHDEVKIKQLLYSLQQKRIWKYHWTDSSSNTLYYYSQVQYQHQKLNELKDLKIKYFSEFSKFKDYVHEKVKSCTDPKKACIAHLDELEMMDTDLKSIFNI